jgi:glycosyltransferase involved in cell wall biosynthesis
MHYAVPRVLAEAGLLSTLYTDTYVGNKPHLRRLLRLLPRRYALIRKLLGREAPGLCAKQVVSFDAFGLRTVWGARRIRSQCDFSQFHARNNQRFCKSVVNAGLSSSRAVYALNGAALEIFRQAKRRGLICILEQTIAPSSIEDRLLAEEAQRWPGTQVQAGLGCADNPLELREKGEWELADCIVCGSDFVASGLHSLGVEPSKCQTVCYGVDTAAFRSRKDRAAEQGLRVLFVGTVGLRKGVPYLLEALRKLDSPRVQARLIGAIEVNRGWLAENLGSARATGPMPRSEILDMYNWADVFVLPSICEGSAVVTYEALACGLPVITTPNAGSVVRDGSDGFVVPIRDSGAIAAALRRFLDDPRLLRRFSENAIARRPEIDLETYATRLIGLVNSLISSSPKPPDTAPHGPF